MISLVIGRFQGLHFGQTSMIRAALMSGADKLQIIIGSSFQPRTHKNPFTFSERAEVIARSFQFIHVFGNNYQAIIDNRIVKVRFSGQRDVTFCNNDDRIWENEINEKVNAFRDFDNEEVTLFGFKKDSSAFYLNNFPQWKYQEVQSTVDMDSTIVREAMFEHRLEDVIGNVPAESENFILKFMNTPEFSYVLGDYMFHKGHYSKIAIRNGVHVDDVRMQPISKIRAASALSAKHNGYYEEIFHCADALIVNEFGEILLIRRKNYPGKGMFAMPGGYMDARTDRNLYDVAVREAEEETSVKGLDGKFDHQQNAISRSLRGRIISDVFRFDVKKADCNISARDDAVWAGWVSLEFVEQNPQLFFEFHDQAILRTMKQ